MKATIYKIVSSSTPLVYIGQTTKPNINSRFAEHRCNYHDYYNSGKGNYRSSYEILKHADAHIEALETIEVEDKKTLSAIERFYIDKENSCNLVNRSHRNKIILTN